MNAEEYLHSMERELKSFPPADRMDLLAEIASHIQSGEDDPHMGDRANREAKVLSEMGDPAQMGRSLRSVHRPNRFVDLLWLLLPVIIGLNGIGTLMANLYPVNNRIPIFSDPQLYMGIRLSILLSLACLLVGWRRRSAPLVIFWSTKTIGSIVTLMTREGRWVPGTSAVPGTAWEGLLYYAILIALLVGLVRLLEQHQFNLLFSAFAGVPLLLTVISYVGLQTFGSVDSLAYIVNLPVIVRAGSLIAFLAGISLFFLVQPRDLRWLGLALVYVTSVFTDVVITYPPAKWMYLGLAVLFIAAWVLDARSRLRGRRDPRVVA
jgi:hypothetical protein